MINTEEIRIIASDSNISHADRQNLLTQADEIDVMAASLILCQQALIESQQHQIATNDRLLEVQKALDAPKLPYKLNVVYGA